MCGLVAIINESRKPVDPQVLDTMRARLAHRGPDDSDTLIEGSVGLGHQRLSIIDVAAGRQPMVIDGVSIAYNGEIYNYIELRDQLISRGHEFRTASDTEVLLRMFLEYGGDMFEHLNGMFAFVIFDPRNRTLTAARDHFGIKPLYLHHGGGSLLFASEIKALLCHPTVQASLDTTAVEDYITFQYVLEDRTLFDNVKKVKPGHVLTVNVDTLDVSDRVYWEPSFAVDLDHTERYFIERLNELIRESVRLQLRSDVPLGAHLSGGMDSSIVATLAADGIEGDLHTFTGAFREGPEFDESRYAKMVSDACGAIPHLVYPTEEEFTELIPKLVYQMDEPAAGPGVFPQYIVSRLASEHVKVVLGGQGGDEIFGGYARYVIAYLEQALKGGIEGSTEEGEHIVSLKSILPNLPYLKQYRPMMSRFWAEGTFGRMDGRYFRLIDRSEGFDEVFSGDFNRQRSREGVFDRFLAVFNHPDTQSYFNKMTHYDMVASLPALLQVEDRMSMSVSLESRVPMLDRRVVDLITSMPPATKFKGGEMKFALKRAIGNVIPEPVLNRRDKMGFPVPIHLWARGRSASFFRDILLSDRCRQRGLFDVDAIEASLADEAPFSRRLWGLLNLELWHREFIDRGHHGGSGAADHS